jgi:hypothetical protein
MNEENKVVTVLTENERFAIFWCFNKAMRYVGNDKEVDPKDVIVNGININETIKNLMGRLFV